MGLTSLVPSASVVPVKDIFFPAFAALVGRIQNPVFMYRGPILCTLYGAVDFLNVLKKYIMFL
jgi:hypothetical protein